MQRLEAIVERSVATADRIDAKVEEIAQFIGTATEEQKATQIRLEKLEEKVDRRFDALVDSLQGFQALAAQQAQTTDRLVQLLSMKAA